MNLFGPLLGIVTVFVIGLGFVWVIRGERYLGYLWWPYFLGVGILLVAGSLFLRNNWISAVLGIAGGSLVWGATELKDQAVRAELGWFPYHPVKLKPPLEKIIKKWRAPSL